MLITIGFNLFYFSCVKLYNAENKMINRILTLLLLTIGITVNSVVAQESISGKDEKKLLEAAESYYFDEDLQNIPKALEIFTKLSKNKPSDPYYKLMEGICYTYFKDKKELALTKLKEVKQQNPEFNEVNFYLGRAYAVNRQFDKAIASYEEYMNNEDVSDEQKSDARQNIIYCQNAKQFLQDSLSVEIINLGSPINTEFAEYVPVITSDETVLIYTYRGNKSKGGLMDKSGKANVNGEYYEDIMISYKLGDDWLEPESIGDNINTVGHDASIALSSDGQLLFIYKSDKKTNGDIYMSELQGEDWTKAEKLQGKVNSDAWEGSASLTSDGKTLYFSSDREGGFGGRDIYSAELQPDNSWGNIKNLGPVINTKFDDDAPFIHPDRRTLYFSSKGHNSMGGYDIFYTYLDDEAGWDEPENVGFPVNTQDDDRYYVLSADAKTGYYSTAGRSKNGMHDIYYVTPGHFGKRPILALVVGVVNKDNEPVEADITVSNAATDEVEGKFKSNSSSGKYMLALTPGNKYKIAIEVEGMDSKIDYIDVQSLETYVQVEHDFNFASQQVVEEVAESKEDVLQSKIDKQIEKFRYESTEKGYTEKVYNKILKEKGDYEEEGVEYFVDVDTKSLNIEGKPVQKKVGANGVEKNVLGPFKSLLAAEVAKQELIRNNPNLNKIDVKVNDAGVDKTIQQYYPNEFTKKDFLEDVTMHDQIVKSDSLTAITDSLNNDKTATDLQEGNEVDLQDGEGLLDAAGKNIAGLKFKVEIGAVTDTADFKLGYLEKYGKITSKTYPDGVTRYTFGPFETLAEAEEFRKMLIEKEKATEDAFVTVFVFGQRKKLDEIPPKQREDLGIDEPKDPVIESEDPCQSNFIDFSEFIGKDLNDKAVYGKLMEVGGSSCAEGLVFKVQIAAYRFPKNYKWKHLKKFGKPVIVDYPDGITRFTQGEFVTMNEAEVLRQKIITAGQTDAWITPFYNGKRMLLEELIEKNFYGKSIN